MSELDFKGSIAIGGLCPLVVTAQAAVVANLQARVQGILALSARLTVTPPVLSGSVDIVAKLTAALTAAVQLQIVFPGVSAQIAALAALVASLEAQLELLLSLQALFGAAGIYAWTFEGVGPDLGPLLAGELRNGWPDGASKALPANALVLATVTPATWAAMKTFFGGAA